jgi:hypothetical protein
VEEQAAGLGPLAVLREKSGHYGVFVFGDRIPFSPKPHSGCIGYGYARYSLERSGKPFLFSVLFPLLSWFVVVRRTMIYS